MLPGFYLVQKLKGSSMQQSKRWGVEGLRAVRMRLQRVGLPCLWPLASILRHVLAGGNATGGRHPPRRNNLAQCFPVVIVTNSLPQQRSRPLIAFLQGVNGMHGRRRCRKRNPVLQLDGFSNHVSADLARLGFLAYFLGVSCRLGPRLRSVTATALRLRFDDGGIQRMASVL